LNVRYAIAAVAALAFASGCSQDPTPITPPPAPASAITVATAAMTWQGSADAAMISADGDCPAAQGLGLRAATADAAVTAVFSDWPAPGTVYDLSTPGTSDLVVVSASAAKTSYCSGPSSVGYVIVHRFEQVGDRYVIDVEAADVGAGAATINAHLYH
jgi:hypothetical protein